MSKLDVSGLLQALNIPFPTPVLLIQGSLDQSLGYTCFSRDDRSPWEQVRQTLAFRPGTATRHTCHAELTGSGSLPQLRQVS